MDIRFPYSVTVGRMAIAISQVITHFVHVDSILNNLGVCSLSFHRHLETVFRRWAAIFRIARKLEHFLIGQWHHLIAP